MNELPGYDAWKLAEPPYLCDEPEVIGKCCVRGCGYAIHEDEDHYEMENGDIVCENCDLDYMRQFRKVGA